MDDTLYTRRETVLGKGDTLFLYTDGVTEAADSGGAFYGKDRLKNFLDANAALPLGELLPGLRSDIAAFTGNADQWDDITMLALKLGSGGTSATITLKADIGELEKLNAFIGRGLDASNCPPRVRNHIELAAEEIFVNISCYSYNGMEKRDVTVECRTEPVPGGMAMILSFTDYGVPFDPTKIAVPDINVPLEEREDGGLGLLIVKKTMDTIHYSRENGANRLVLTKSWQKEGQ
jgi:sigma-B regulation protein RsbU (phosphoserine phosphatase)